MKRILVIVLFFISKLTFTQVNDSINLKIDYVVKSEELQEFFSFENIDFYMIEIQNEALKNKNVILLSKEYWNKELRKIDTVAVIDKASYKIQDELNINVITRKIAADSLKVNFHFKEFFTSSQSYKTTKTNTYSTRDLSNGLNTKVNVDETFPLLVYSLPYENLKSRYVILL